MGGHWDGRLGSLGDLAEWITARHAHIMSDAGLAGPLPELLFPSVLLATALILLFNAVVNCSFSPLLLFSYNSALFFPAISDNLVIYLVLHSRCRSVCLFSSSRFLSQVGSLLVSHLVIELAAGGALVVRFTKNYAPVISKAEGGALRVPDCLIL
ncbi:hypothetical protein F5Y01DRAFT_150620 [Xylaria sp. FL0043]|nr:hypothetical protein F5Y01DRAFT_150620 [Xylaria sp. FL0043]